MHTRERREIENFFHTNNKKKKKNIKERGESWGKNFLSDMEDEKKMKSFSYQNRKKWERGER